MPTLPSLLLSLPEFQTSPTSLDERVSNLQNLDLSNVLVLGVYGQAFGGYSNIYDGRLPVKSTTDGRFPVLRRKRAKKVAVKCFRIVIDERRREFEKSFARELCVWSRLNHSNVLPLLGFAIFDHGENNPPFVSLISEWMENQTVKVYMQNYPESCAFQMAAGIANGLAYLHSIEVIHADLKLDNVVVSPDGMPLLIDFGVSRCLVDAAVADEATDQGGTIRWKAPELFESYSSSSTSQIAHTKATDVWAFGMVIYELIACKIPYHHLPNNRVEDAICRGERPTKPKENECTESDMDSLSLWDIANGCWAMFPQKRPTIHVVPETLTPIMTRHIHETTLSRTGTQDYCNRMLTPFVYIVNTVKKLKTETADDIDEHTDLITDKHTINNDLLRSVLDDMAMMQERMSKLQVDSTKHKMLARELYNVQMKHNMLLPGVELMAGEVRRIGTQPIGGSAEFDIWEGLYLENEKCTLKVIRAASFTEKQRTRLSREVRIWRKLWEIDGGKFVVRFYGICFIDGPYPYIVNPYFKNGDALKYIRLNPDVNRLAIIRHVAQGLTLLHRQDPPIAHGELKAAKIMITDDGYPLLAEFGLSKMIENATNVPFTQTNLISTQYRWFAPEVCSDTYSVSTASDVFSFAMTILELMTGSEPFANIRRPPEVLMRIQRGERPPRPTEPRVEARGLDDKMWNLLERCWAHVPEDRPTMEQMLEELPVVVARTDHDRTGNLR